MPRFLNAVLHLLKRSLRGAWARTVGAVGRTNAANVEWHFAFATAIVAWCIGPAPSVQFGGQMPQMLNCV
jgi:hypothetical protein